MNLRRPHINRYTLFGIFAILLWSTTVALARSLSEQVGPITAGAAVFLSGGVISIAPTLRSGIALKQFRNLPRNYLLICGGLFVFYMFALFLSIGLAHNHHQVLEAGLLNYLWPSLTILFSLVILKKKAGILLLPGTLCALAGIYLVLTRGSTLSWHSFLMNLNDNPGAYLLAISAAVSWALYSNLARRLGGSEADGGVPFFILATGLVLFLLIMVRPEAGYWTTRAVLETGFMSITTILAYAAWDTAMRKGDVVLIASFSYFTPFFSTLVTCSYLSISAGMQLWIGCVLIVAGSLLSWTSISDSEPDTNG